MAASMGLASLDSFQGETAENVKSYFGDMHAKTAGIDDLMSQASQAVFDPGVYASFTGVNYSPGSF